MSATLPFKPFCHLLYKESKYKLNGLVYLPNGWKIEMITMQGNLSGVNYNFITILCVKDATAVAGHNAFDEWEIAEVDSRKYISVYVFKDTIPSAIADYKDFYAGRVTIHRDDKDDKDDE